MSRRKRMTKVNQKCQGYILTCIYNYIQLCNIRNYLRMQLPEVLPRSKEVWKSLDAKWSIWSLKPLGCCFSLVFGGRLRSYWHRRYEVQPWKDLRRGDSGEIFDEFVEVEEKLWIYSISVRYSYCRCFQLFQYCSSLIQCEIISGWTPFSAFILLERFAFWQAAKAVQAMYSNSNRFESQHSLEDSTRWHRIPLKLPP